MLDPIQLSEYETGLFTSLSGRGRHKNVNKCKTHVHDVQSFCLFSLNLLFCGVLVAVVLHKLPIMSVPYTTPWHGQIIRKDANSRKCCNTAYVHDVTATMLKERLPYCIRLKRKKIFATGQVSYRLFAGTNNRINEFASFVKNSATQSSYKSRESLFPCIVQTFLYHEVFPGKP